MYATANQSKLCYRFISDVHNEATQKFFTTYKGLEMKKNPVRHKLAKGQPTYGGWLAIPSGFSAEVMAHAGFDWLNIDMQHGLIDFSSLINMLQVISTTDTVPIVRPLSNDAAIIGQVLDAGARGVIVPMVNSREDAINAAQACRYAPRGIRSYGPARASIDLGVPYGEFPDSDALCLIMLETVEAINNIEDIASVPGIDGIFIGPGDLNVSMGLPPNNDSDNQQFMAALEKTLDVCDRNLLIPGIFADPNTAQKRFQQGFKFVPIAVDFGLLATGADNALRLMRG